MVQPDWLLFAEINPHSIIRGKTFPEGMPAATVNASRWYDVVLLWSKSFAADMTDAQRAKLRERYRFQLGYLRSLGQRLNGGAPTLIGGFGIPYDLNDGESYGRWSQGEHGADVWRAQSLALGARGTLIGKAFLHGLGAMGQAGVRTALELIRKELDVSMALTGIRDVADIDGRVLWKPSARP